MKLVFLFLYSIILALPLKAQDQQVVPFTLADRDRIMRTEVKLEALESKMEAKFIAADSKMEANFTAIDAKIDAIYWILSGVIALNLFMLGFMIWDRRTSIKPAMDKAEAAELLSSTNTRVLRDFSKDQPKLAEILKMHGLL